MKRSPKKGAGKGQEESASNPISQGDELEDKEEEGLEEAQAPLLIEEELKDGVISAEEIEAAESKGEVFVTLAVYSKRYKDLSDKQFKAGAVEAKGLIDLGPSGIFAPGEVYKLNQTADTEKLMREGFLIRMSGSFSQRGIKK